MRSVAGQAGEFPAAVSETRRLIQIGWLVTDVPGVRPIVFLAGLRRLAMAYATVLIEFRGVELLWIANGSGCAAGGDVSRSRAVTRLATHACLRGFDGVPEPQGGLSCRVTSKAAGDG